MEFVSDWIPAGFSWIEQPHLAALARPYALEDLTWLREQGLQLLISLTEMPLRSDWINEAGLLSIHIPIEDMHAPTMEQLDCAVSAIRRAREKGIGLAVHCAAGLGRTGTVLAAYLVSQGFNAREAIARVRELRPGSVETSDQEAAIEEYASRLRGNAEGDFQSPPS
jgi:atypical dual specificity phosphatase